VSIAFSNHPNVCIAINLNSGCFWRD